MDFDLFSLFVFFLFAFSCLLFLACFFLLAFIYIIHVYNNIRGIEIVGVTPTPPAEFMTTSTGGFPIMIIYGMART